MHIRNIFFIILAGGVGVRRDFKNPVTKVNMKFLSCDALVLFYCQWFTANGLRVKVIHECKLERVRSCRDADVVETTLQDPKLNWRVPQIFEGHRHDANRSD